MRSILVMPRAAWRNMHWFERGLAVLVYGLTPLILLYVIVINVIPLAVDALWTML